MEKTKTRAYFICNMYTAGIHAGIQAQHCTSELFVKYSSEPDKSGFLWQWAREDKVTILLNGGYQQNLLDFESFFKYSGCRFPWTSWRESQEALNGALTCVGVIVPVDIFDELKTARERGDDPDGYCTALTLADKLSTLRLMN